MTISVQPSALADLRKGYHFYERQGCGLGSYFLDTMFSDIDSLRLYAGIHPVHFGKFFRLLSARFPFAVYHEVEAGAALIRAVLDLRRNPTWIENKLRNQ